VLLFAVVPGSFLPDEDQGFLFLDVQLPNASALSRTEATMQQVEDVLKNTEGVAGVISIAGSSLLQGGNAPNGGFAIISLDPWEKRRSPALSTAGLLASLNARFATIPQANIGVFAPPAIPGVGQVGGLDFRLQAQAGQSSDDLVQVARALVAAAGRTPEIAFASSSFPRMFQEYS
jgi:multidrug efflux pump subunit AcrB